tara:strand:- start:110 stop:385 length:276 start_codon:yes stop_codon:yes gene_type:complete
MKARMYNFSDWVFETDPKALQNKYNKALQKSGFDVISYVEKYFTPQGYTALFLLGESHLAIHTFPEQNASYIELCSCVQKPFYKFIQIVTK